MNLQLLEHSLKKRWDHNYDWKGNKQNDIWDAKKNLFIQPVRIQNCKLLWMIK